MKCYYHHQSDAVAICKSCGRGLCPECEADVGPGSACKQRCENDVKDLNTIIQRSKSAYQKTGAVYKRSAMALLVMGIIFIFIGVLPIIMLNNYGSSFMAVLGIVFVIWSLGNFKSARQITSVKEDGA